jgi:hypothetical protein
VRGLQASVFKQKDIDFFHKIAESEEQYASMEEAAAAHGGLHDIAERLGVAERFLHELWQVPRLREKLAVLAFWHSYHDECTQAQVRSFLPRARNPFAPVAVSSLNYGVT